MLRKALLFSQRTINTIFFGLGVALFAAQAQAAQTGSISGQVTDASGAGVADVSIEASSDVLPQARTTSSAANGKYRLRFLTPGDYTVKFTYPSGDVKTRQVPVLLQQTTALNVAPATGDMDEVIVTGQRTDVGTGSGSLKDAIDFETLDSLPVGDNYRDLMKLIPGVMYTEDVNRGPSAGGSGQDNVYQFDGVDVSLPLFGVLSSEPSTQDIDQVSVIRGGAKSIGFNRSGGFLINSTSKRGTNEIKGEVGYKLQSSGMTEGQDKGEQRLSYNEDRSWLTANVGGAIVQDRLFFYVSYYRPDHSRDNVSNVYGSVGDYKNLREEYFTKLTYAPTDDITLDLSYRTSDRETDNEDIGEFDAASTSQASVVDFDTLNFEASWIINDDSSVNFKMTDYKNKNLYGAENDLGLVINEGDSLDIANLDRMGYVGVPSLDITDPIDAAYNLFIQPVIDKYGYDSDGGGNVGAAQEITDIQFLRDSWEIGYDHTFYFGDVTWDFHVGYQFMEVEEDIRRASNGWGRVTVPGGTTTAPVSGAPIYYQARLSAVSFYTATGESLPTIVSSSESESFEIHNSLEWHDFTFDLGLMMSNDVLYGQGLLKAWDIDPVTGDVLNPVTGFIRSVGTKYEMYEVDWSDQIAPRLGVTWNYSDTGSVYISGARYYPSASSLARAASWDRDTTRSVWAYFDQNGDWIEMETDDASTGKWFDDGLDPRYTDEIILGTKQILSSEWILRAHVRHRFSQNFWEDTGNSDFSRYPHPEYFGAPADNRTFVPEEDLYIPYLADVQAEIGGGSYVIAQLPGAYTKYWEASVEVDWNRDKWFVTASYTWSHYWGNMDQDNTSTVNDAARFIGSSSIGDGMGRQPWNFKDGNLRGDRRHKLKMYGFYKFDFDATLGAFLVYQSGQPWEAWNVEYYWGQRDFENDTIRFAEPAGSRTTDAHWQLDLNYTQNFRVGDSQNVQLRADLYNALDNQTGYNVNPDQRSSTFGDPRSYNTPRRLQLAVKYQF